MAKKNLAALMNGIMGDPISESQDISSSQEEQLVRKPGRPRRTDSDKAKEIRATFIVNQDILQKIKYVSLVDGNLLKDVIDIALSKYIEEWEEQNGKIRIPKR